MTTPRETGAAREGETFVCLRRFDEKLGQMVFEPLPSALTPERARADAANREVEKLESTLWDARNRLSILGPRVRELEASATSVASVVQQFLDTQGHERCWYYPNLFNELVTVLGIEQRAPSELPSRAEFEAGCARYQREQYGEAEPECYLEPEMPPLASHEAESSPVTDDDVDRAVSLLLESFAASRGRDTARLAALNAQIRDDKYGDVTLTASDSPPMRTVNIYLGEAAVPVGVGTDLGGAIDAMCDSLASSEGETR